MLGVVTVGRGVCVSGSAWCYSSDSHSSAQPAACMFITEVRTNFLIMLITQINNSDRRTAGRAGVVFLSGTSSCLKSILTRCWKEHFRRVFM